MLRCSLGPLEDCEKSRVRIVEMEGSKLSRHSSATTRDFDMSHIFNLPNAPRTLDITTKYQTRYDVSNRADDGYCDLDQLI